MILEVSRADRAMLAAWIPSAPSPSIDALTSAPTRFSVVAPAPLAERPKRPPATATDAATTRASIVWLESASSVTLPPAVTLERSIRAWTSAADFVPSTV